MNPAISEHEAASLAAEMFDHFCAATTMRQILGLYRNMCDILGLRPGPLNEFYPKFKAKIRNWKAQALWKKFDARASHRVYNKGTAASGTRVLVIGAGPCGLRTAIEAQLLGAKVVVVEKRDRITRNNVLHLWPFLITDLKALGAKKFYGKFCAGSIDHISIRQLQCILLKVALLLGVEIHEGVSFIREIEPKDGCGWRAAVSPEDHAVSHYEFDVLIGADGKRNTLEGFKRKEFRGKLAIAITANFINKKTEAEAKVEEISGVAFIFNQSFFKELYQTTGIDLENIVYYKDETHYFVMTAKKHSLLDKGVIIQDYADPAELLSSANVDTSKLLDYAREAADFSTKYQMPNLEFAVNHYGKPDVAMFDFTSMFAADNSCKLTVRKNYRLLSCLVGDSLLEPFWPTGSGCARGFLSSMDAAYAIKLFSNSKNSLLAVLAQRESIYRLLAQTTPENLHRDIGAYTLDPSTRYPNLNKSSVNMIQVKHLLDTDDPTLLEQTFLDSNSLTAGPEVSITKRKRRTNDTVPLGTVLLRWVKSQLKDSAFVQDLTDAAQCFINGRVLCTLINRYRPDLVNLEELEICTPEDCNEHAFSILEDHLGIPRVMSGQESVTLGGVDSKLWLNYLEQICEVFRGEIPHVKHPKLDYAEFKQKQQINSMEEFAKLRRFAANRMATMNEPAAVTPGTATAGTARKSSNYFHTNEEERIKRSRKVLGAESSPMASPQTDTTKRAKKRRSYEKFGNIEERTRRLQEIETNRVDRQTKRRLARAQQTQNFYTSLHMLQANTFLRESDSSSAFEDYSLFLYRQSAPEFNDRVKEMERKILYPDRDRGLAAAYPRSLIAAAANDGEQFSDRIKSMEQRIVGKQPTVTEKKPKDLLRAIGKIDSNDWNVKEIEKKIELSKKATDIGKSRERVPKWNREQFLARQNKLTQQPEDEKYKEFDSSLKAIDKQLKEGHNLDLGERGKNKVASIAGQLLSTKQQQRQQQQQQQQQQHHHHPKSTSKAALVLTSSGAAEKCHFCKQRVYLMEKISAEGLTLHRSCLKCHHCHTNLRLGGYAFDRDDPEGKFYCTQHFKLPSKVFKPLPKRSLPRTPQSGSNNRNAAASAAAAAGASAIQPLTPDSKSSSFDLLDRGETPERIEFENADESISDSEAAMEVIDENEWTDRNFGTESDESDEDMSSSDESDSESDSDYEEAAGSPLGAQTLQLASEWISDKRFSNMVDSDDDFYGYSSEDDEADSQTEGEEFARAREIRMQEVKLMPPPTLPTDTETEVASKQQPQVVPTVSLNQLSNALCTVPNPISTAPSVNNPPQPQVESAEDRALREKMLQKLSIREQWLHSSAPMQPEAVPAPDVQKPKTSFFGGLMNSLSTLIKSDKQPPKPSQSTSPPQVAQDSPLSSIQVPQQVDNSSSPSLSPSVRQLALSFQKPPPSPTPSLKKSKLLEVPPSPTPSLKKQSHPEVPPSPTASLKKPKKHRQHTATPSPTPSSGSQRLSEDGTFDELFSDDLKSASSGRSTPRSKRRTHSKSKEVRQDTDEFLEQIKQDQAALDQRMKKVEAKKFKSNMQSIKSAVEGSRIVGVKSEKDVSKFFGGPNQQQKPKQLPNKDVSALQGINLSKYFPTAANSAPTSAKASIGTPSSVSSVESSPMLGRKKPSEVELRKYFGPSPTAKSSPSSPSSLVSPAISRKNSIESPGSVRKSISAQPNPKPPAVLAPKPPMVPLPPRKNVLAFQPIKKSKTESVLPASVPTKNVLAFQPVAKPKPASPKPAPKVRTSPPKQASSAPRKSPEVEDKLFENLLQDVNRPASSIEETLFDDLLSKVDNSPKVERKNPPTVKPSTPPQKLQSLDEQIFEDLLGEVDESLIENFEEIVGLPKKQQSPKLGKKKTSPKRSPKGSPKHSPPSTPKKSAEKKPPKMTLKRPAFKIDVPVKMQETLEEIYLASLSKLDTRSMSMTSLNSVASKSSDGAEHHQQEGKKVEEAFEQLLLLPEADSEPVKIQPFQAPQRAEGAASAASTTKQQQEPTGGNRRRQPPEEGKASSEASPSKKPAKERTLDGQVLPLEAKPVTTPKLSQKIMAIPINSPDVQIQKTNHNNNSVVRVEKPVQIQAVAQNKSQTTVRNVKQGSQDKCVVGCDTTKKVDVEVCNFDDLLDDVDGVEPVELDDLLDDEGVVTSKAVSAVSNVIGEKSKINKILNSTVDQKKQTPKMSGAESSVKVINTDVIKINGKESTPPQAFGAVGKTTPSKTSTRNASSETSTLTKTPAPKISKFPAPPVPTSPISKQLQSSAEVPVGPFVSTPTSARKSLNQNSVASMTSKQLQSSTELPRGTPGNTPTLARKTLSQNSGTSAISKQPKHEVAAVGTPPNTPIIPKRTAQVPLSQMTIVEPKLTASQTSTNASTSQTHKVPIQASQPLETPKLVRKITGPEQSKLPVSSPAVVRKVQSISNSNPTSMNNVIVLETDNTAKPKKLDSSKDSQPTSSVDTQVVSHPLKAVESASVHESKLLPTEAKINGQNGELPAEISIQKSKKLLSNSENQSKQERKPSKDDLCFEELRTKHEAIFSQQPPTSTATTRSEFFKDLTKTEDSPVVDSKPVEVPRTLSEFRSTILVKPTRTEDKTDSDIAPILREKINELVMEIMPGASLDQIVDEIPIPAERKKSSFQKMFNKLQRANTIAAPEGSSLKSLLTPAPSSRGDEYKMEVVREKPVQSDSKTAEKTAANERIQINLERTAQIKEKYIKQRAPSPPKSSGSPPKPVTAQPSLERKGSFKIQPTVPVRAPTRKTQSPPKPMESSLSAKKSPSPVDRKSNKSAEKSPAPETVQDVRETTPKRPLPAHGGYLDITPIPPARKGSRKSRSPSVVSEALKVSLKMPVPVDIDREVSILSRDQTNRMVSNFDDLLDSVDSMEVVEFDDLLGETSTSTATTREEKVVDKNTVSKEKVTKQPEKPAIVTSKNILSEEQFNQTSKELAEKFLNSKLPSSQQLSKDQPKKLDTNALITTLTETTSLLEKPEFEPSKPVASSDLINSSTSTLNELNTLPDIVSMTRKSSATDEVPPVIKASSHQPDKIEQTIKAFPQEIQVYTLHTAGDGVNRTPAEPQPSTSGMTGEYAHILRDITSGLVGADYAAPVMYEPPPAIDTKPKSNFTTYKQILDERAGGTPDHPSRPLRKPKPIDRSVSPLGKPFDNSICIDPWRAKRSASIENIAIDQVFVKQDDKVIDTFYVVPELGPPLKRRSKSVDRLTVPSTSKAVARQHKKSFDELRDYGFDVEPPASSKHLINPRLRHFNIDESDEDLPSLQEHRRQQYIRKCKSTVDTSRLEVDVTRVDIDRESPIPRSTDFSKWEAILDRGVPYYQEPKVHKKEDVKALERKLEDIKSEYKPRRKVMGKGAIPKDYDPEEYVPRINRRVIDSFEIPDPNLPKSYDPEEYVPRAQRTAHRTTQDIPTSTASLQRPPRSSAYETDVPITRTGSKYHAETLLLDDIPHTLPRSKTSTHVPFSSSRSYDLPSREVVPRAQLSRRNLTGGNRTQQLHEKANKFLRSQITRNDPNPYIRALADSDDDDYPLPITSSSSSSHRVPITTTSAISSYHHHPVSTYGTSNAAALSRITTKAITQPSRMTHYTRKDVPSSSSTAGARSYHHRGGESSNSRRENCAISGASDSESCSEEINSATEISTDSEFDHEPSHRLPPRIFIDDTHLKRPAKVQVKQMTIENGVRMRRQFPVGANANSRQHTADNQHQRANEPSYPFSSSNNNNRKDIHLEFKPLVEVDPSIKLSQHRAPLSIPRPGDYTLSKTASTEGIASKKSLELKKKYLLGESLTGGGVLKSGSASALDSKFKSFHSNITECQKLLHPAPEVSPAMQTFLQKTASVGQMESALPTLLSLRKEALMAAGRNDEKENVYDGKIVGGGGLKRYAETINATLVENKLNEMKKEDQLKKEDDCKKDDRPNNNEELLIETISLITPEKIRKREEQTEEENKNVEQSKGNGGHDDKIVEIKNISNLKHMFIDLTADSPNCDRSLVETTLNFSMTAPSAREMKTLSQTNGALKNNVPDIISSIKMDSNDNKVHDDDDAVDVDDDGQDERARSPAHETSIQVPDVPWDNEAEEEDDDSDESDSISESASSTSSVDDIPHFILDSTTSPETQNTDERFVPRVEIRDTTGELMQIDSLMIIDGKYIGDPEDLKLLEKLPPDTKIAAEIAQQEMNLDSIMVTEDVHDIKEEKAELKTPTPPEETTPDKIPAPIPLPVLELEPHEGTPPPIPPAAPVSKPSSPTQPKPDLKFDTRNENKLESMINLPLVLDQIPADQPVQKPRHLSFTAPRKSPDTDAEKTPLAPTQLLPQLAKAEGGDGGSESETEVTTQNLTETELSDWAADDAVSENFVDIEFALNSNKGTIKRNKPKHGRLQQKKLIAQAMPLGPKLLAKKQPRAPEAEDGIMKNLAVEDIEFMDTGSEEESCIESYSATNRQMLKNRGYVEFVDPCKDSSPTILHSVGNGQGYVPSLVTKTRVVEAINRQVAGVDYIEQGAYLLNNGGNVPKDDTQTPMNEVQPSKITFGALAAQNKALTQPGSEPSQPQLQQPDSFNDIEEDSLLVVTSSQGTATTTEESEAPTIVAGTTDRTATTTTGSGGSSGRCSVSSFGSKHVEAADKSSSSPVRKVSTESSSAGKRGSLDRNCRKDSLKNSIEDIGYDEYVKRLQQKIAQISNARDSLEVKKSKRKSSKGELGQEVVITEIPPTLQETTKKPVTSSIYTEQSAIEVPKSVEKKIEEITKERVKQKDIIHDLVMDKLQTKKQLNAEKRMNRIRNRTNALGGQSPVTPNSQPQPSPIAMTDTAPSYHPIAPERRNRLLGTTEQLETAAPKVSLYSSASFKHPATVSPPVSPNKENIAFNTPASAIYNISATPRTTVAKPPPDESLTLTEQLREEARARARLKSNQDLGLSPEDRVLLLRKKFHINLRELNDQQETPQQQQQLLPQNKSDDLKFKERHHGSTVAAPKLMTSKSVNDVSMLKNLTNNDPDFISPCLDTAHGSADAGSAAMFVVGSKLNDYVSDPNLMQSPSTNPNGTGTDELRLRTRNKCKDRERRKSIIEKVSDFFNSRKKTDSSSGGGGGGSGSKDSSPTKDGKKETTSGGSGSTDNQQSTSGTSSSGGGGGGGFLRFKISPKLKDKSKPKEGSPYEQRCVSEACLKNTNATQQASSNTASPPSAGRETTSTSTTSSPVISSAAGGNSFTPIGRKEAEELEPPPIPPLPLNYQRSDDESCTTNEPKNELKKLRAMSKASRQAELKRLRIAQEIQREQEEIEVKIKDLETRGVEIEKELRGESESLEKNIENLGANDEGLVKEWLEIMRSITRLKVRDEELTIRQQELQLEHRHAQLKEELNMRLSCSKLDKNSSDVAAEGAILNEMLEIVAKRQALRPSLDAAVAAAAAAASAVGLPHSVASSSTRMTTNTDI